jgi:hypothetical protein
MPDDTPSPPPELPPAVVEALESCSPDRLRDAARYAEALAEHHERQARLESDAAGENPEEDHPDGVPSKATTTIKEINDNRYYYWQWREGDRIKSKYKGPVDPDE